MQLVGDWENGNLYELSLDTFDDDGQERLHIRSWPNTSNDGDLITYDRFIVDMEVGQAGSNDAEPQIRLRWSDTRGHVGTPLSRGLGERGQFGRRAQFNRLGCDRGRDASSKCRGPRG